MRAEHDFEKEKEGRACKESRKSNLLKVISHVYHLGRRKCAIVLGIFPYFFFPSAKLFILTSIVDYKLIHTSLKRPNPLIQAPESWY